MRKCAGLQFGVPVGAESQDACKYSLACRNPRLNAGTKGEAQRQGAKRDEPGQPHTRGFCKFVSGAGVDSHRETKSDWDTPPRVFSEKRLDLLDCKGFDFFESAKEPARPCSERSYVVGNRRGVGLKTELT
jgi:hypothetical protein